MVMRDYRCKAEEVSVLVAFVEVAVLETLVEVAVASPTKREYVLSAASGPYPTE